MLPQSNSGSGALAGRAAAALVLCSAFGHAQEAQDPPLGPGAVPRGSGEAVRRPADDAPAAPRIEMPVLEHFEPAAYPPEAQAAGLEGDVVLVLDIDATGAVLRAEPAAPVGHGFDESAVAAARLFRFRPAMRDGTPVAVRIQYLYRFTLSPPAADAPEAAPPPPPTTGNLGGALRIGEDDAPLAGAEVTVVAPDGRRHVVVTDATGAWSLADLPPGRYGISVRAPGFAPLEVAEDVVAGDETHATYRLDPASDGVEIVVRGERPPREVTRRTIERREM
jgi:TonB family protein